MHERILTLKDLGQTEGDLKDFVINIKVSYLGGLSVEYRCHGPHLLVRWFG